jgi:hypothetical protein
VLLASVARIDHRRRRDAEMAQEWVDLELPDDVRRLVTRAAALRGESPEEWLDRVVKAFARRVVFGVRADAARSHAVGDMHRPPRGRR